MEHFGGLGEAAVVDHCLQGSPLIEGHAWHFHSIVFLLRLSGTLASLYEEPTKMKRIRFAAFASLTIIPLSALAVSYPVDVEQELNGADVLATTETIDRDMAGLMLQTLGTRPVDCTAVFRNGPEAPRTRHTALAAGERKPLVAKFKRDVIRLRIKLTCEPQPSS